MAKSGRSRHQSNNSYLKSSSLNFLNDISGFNSTENLNTDKPAWRDSFSFSSVLLGRGHFSKVYKAKCLLTGKYVAVKVIRRRRLGVDKVNDILNEIDIMEILNKSSNTAFIQLLTFHISNTEVSVILEFASGGSIYNVVKDSTNGLPELYSRIILSKVITALCFMHEHNIVHLDIKADNILLRYPYPSTDVAVADFGLAKKLSKTKIYKEMIGTPDYISPEVSNYDNISTKSDMWSVGVLTYFMLTNISPFSAVTKEETLSLVSKAQFKFQSHLEQDNYSLARDFISHLLIKIPEKRFNAEECLNHDFLSSSTSVEYQLSMTQNTNKKVQTTISKDSEYAVNFDDSTFYKKKDFVTSQYDFVKGFEKSHLPETDDILKQNFTNCTLNLEKSSSSENLQSVKNTDNLCWSEELLNKNSENSELIDCCTDQNKSNINHPQVLKACSDMNENTNYKPKFDEYLSLDYQVKNIKERYADKRNDDSLVIEDEITSGWNELTYFEDSFKDSANTNIECKPKITKPNSYFNNLKSVKENKNFNDVHDTKRLLNIFFNKTKIYDSRRRTKNIAEKPALGTISFRTSRNNLLDKNYPVNHFDDISNYWTDHYSNSTSQKYNIMNLRNENNKVKKRTIMRSLKKDFDKPFDNSFRTSQGTLKANSFKNILENYNQKKKTNSFLKEIHTDYFKRKNSNKFEILNISRKRKSEEKKNLNCIIC